MKLKDTVHRNLPKNLLILAVIVALIAVSIISLNVDFTELAENADEMVAFLSRFLKPDFSYFPAIVKPLIDTLKMSLYGTFLGVMVALPMAFLGSTVFTDNNIVTSIARFIMGVIRTVPSLLLAAILVAIFGIGEFTGVLSIAIFTFGMNSQLFYQAIDTIDRGPVEAQESVGANKIKVAFYAILPQISKQIASYSLYAFEVNIRASTVLGYVGAGGIGTMLNTSLGFFRYDRVALIILVIFVVVFVVDAISGYLRRELS